MNGINFQPVSKIGLEEFNGETLVFLYDDNDLVARIPFYDITSYRIKELEEDDF